MDVFNKSSQPRDHPHLKLQTYRALTTNLPVSFEALKNAIWSGMTNYP